MSQDSSTIARPTVEYKPEYFAAAREGIARLTANIRTVIIIETVKLEYIVAAKLAGGHVILADEHGVGKTSLAKALAGSIRWDHSKTTHDGVKLDPFNRVQCTVDLLPQDILGFNRMELQSINQTFVRGPIFAHFVLCDEINLLTPKTQGSFLQAMEERTVTVEGRSYRLPEPFFIIATMNLRGAHLFPLPAPQLDRFMIRISLGYPPAAEELEILLKHGRENAWDGFGPVVEAGELTAWQQLVDGISLHNDVAQYIVKLIRKTREYPGIASGASPRAGIKLSRLVRALALVRGRDYADLDLVKELVPSVLAHRIELEDPSADPNEVLRGLVKELRV